jgi:hypothetical protein
LTGLQSSIGPAVQWPSAATTSDGTPAKALMARSPVRLFNLSLVENPCLRRKRFEPKHRYVRLTPTTCNLSMQSCVELRRTSNKGWQSWAMATSMLAMKSCAANPASRRLTLWVTIPPTSRGLISKMSRRRNVPGFPRRWRSSAATWVAATNRHRKFVRLVGCRDPKARPEPQVRPIREQR